MYQAPKQNDALGTTNRGNPCESGLCILCTSDCKGKCETWLSSLVGRKLLYPREFGWTTSGSAHTVSLGVGYHALRVGDNPGEHTIVFGLLGETIELTVRATNRDSYALGALAAAMGYTIFVDSSYAIIIILLFLMGPRHPPTGDDTVPLGRTRIILGWLTLAFIVVGFTPRPIIMQP